MSKNIKLLIDTDAGIDDSVAILYAGSRPEVDIVAITSCYGTASVENTTNNVRRLCHLAGIHTRVAAGRGVPIIAPPMPVGGFHGESGVGLAQLPQNALPLDEDYAWDVMYQEAKRAGKLTIMVLGPLTNMAIALMKYEDLPQYLERIVIMGGSTEAGNVGALAEANVAHDPHATEIVFRCGAPVTLAGLNATETTRMTTEEWNHLFSKRTYLWRVLRDMFATYKHSQNTSGEVGLVIHDAAAMLVALQPQTATTQPYYVQCETTPGPMYGRTVADFRPYAPGYASGEKNVDVVEKIDKDAFLQAMDEMLEHYAQRS